MLLTKLTRGNQITIPKPIIEQAHLKSGSDYLEVEYQSGIIYLKPVDVEERITPEIYEKFQKEMLTIEKDDIVLDETKAKNFLANRSKKSK